MERVTPELAQVEEVVPETAVASDFVVGASRSMKDLEQLIRELSGSDMPVLLMSEAGCGKRATAEHIHRLSRRREHPFLVVSGSQLADSSSDAQAICSQFFTRGTLYLEEVGNLSLATQKGLLAVISSEETDGNQPQFARLICGTERDLEVEVREGRFREDLYYTISKLSLRLPPLRQRKNDLLHLLGFFLKRYSAEFRCAVPALSVETQQQFLEYSWPGNLRELQEAARVIVLVGDEALAMGGLRSLLTKGQRSNGERLSLKEVAKAASREAEKQLILQVLTRTRWNRRRAAQELQISYKALLYKLKQIGYGVLRGAP